MKSIHNVTSSRIQRGFTLIELMIVVAIIGIISAIAYPSYQESVAKSRRADAQRALMEADQYMRRYFSATDTYVGATIPGSLAASPRDGTTAYNIAFTGTPTATTYTITATRTGSMAGDRCGDLSINQIGTQTIANQSSGLTRSDCFKGS